MDTGSRVGTSCVIDKVTENHRWPALALSPKSPKVRSIQWRTRTKCALIADNSLSKNMTIFAKVRLVSTTYQHPTLLRFIAENPELRRR